MASETKTGVSRKSSVETTPPKVVKKAATKTAEKKKTAVPAQADKPVVRKAPTPRKTKSTGQPITADGRLRHIEVAAYYIAENSGFSRSPADCWIAAESEIDGLLLSGKL